MPIPYFKDARLDSLGGPIFWADATRSLTATKTGISASAIVPARNTYTSFTPDVGGAVVDECTRFRVELFLPAGKVTACVKYSKEFSNRSTFQGYSVQISGTINF